MPKKRWTVSVDFDGVIHKYETRWINAHTIPDDPVDGAIPWLLETLRKYDVVIFSTRCKTWRGRRAIRAWLKKHSGTCWNESMDGPGIEDVKVSYKKTPALVYIDDRGYRFDGTNWPTVEQVRKLRPWNKP